MFNNLKLVLTVLSFLIASNTLACSCVERSSNTESSSWAKHVFVGKIKTDSSVKENGFVTKHFELSIVETIKGSPKEGYFIKPSPMEILTNCYPQNIAVGDLYVFFVQDNKETTLHHCSGTVPFKYLESSQPKWRDNVKSSH